MKITAVNLPKDDEKGLEEIKMKKLDRIVLLAGKNGAGKSRILNKIFTTFAQKPKKSELDQIKLSLKNWENAIASTQKSIHKLEIESSNPQTNSDRKDELKGYIESYKKNIENYENSIENQKSKPNWKYIETDIEAEKYNAVYFVPKKLDLRDCNEFSKKDLLHNAESIKKIGTENLASGTFAAIQSIQNRWFEATHPNTNSKEEEKNKAITDYKKLKESIQLFLNTEIERAPNGEATLFGFPLGKAQLSDGQKILLQFCLAIYSQEQELADLILILDEPENHLHPSIIIETIEKIKNCVPNGQIWIATHSIPLLAHFDTSSIWFVEKNTLRHGGKIAEQVLKSLLGDENEIAKLKDFMDLPAQYATIQYCFESLFEPKAVTTDGNDPQSYQIRQNLLKQSEKKDKKLRILDYGAGKGRLISNIVEIDQTNQEKLIEQIDYIAFDKFLEDQESCKKELTQAYSSYERRYFNKMSELLSHYDKKSFDVIIMCNVLHEIDPKDWLKLFGENGEISSLLSDNGILLLVEDHQIPIGEKAYQNGFLVLDTAELKELFGITEQDVSNLFIDQQKKGRLKAHRIPKHCLTRIDTSSRIKSIQSLSKRAKDEILRIRNNPEKNYQNGKLHGFWMHQLTNAELILAELGGTD